VGKVTNWLLVIGHFAALSLVIGHFGGLSLVIGHFSYAKLYHQWCFLAPKTAKTGEKWGFFWCKTRVFWCFLMKNEAKSVFFEAFLGLKYGKKGLLSANYVPEMD
jgi:hypothetical protein